MRRIESFLRLVACFGFAAFVGPPLVAQDEPVHRRADANSNGIIDISDAIHLLTYLFNGGPAPRCPGVADANGSGDVDIADGIAILDYLFSGIGTLPPLSEAELEECNAPPEPTVLRHGSFLNVSEPSHAVSGRVEHVSDGTIRITNFHFDGEGVPRVVVFLQKNGWWENLGHAISPDLLRGSPYAAENLTYPIPPGVTADMFKYVSIYCDFFPQTYAYARMTDGPFP